MIDSLVLAPAVNTAVEVSGHASGRRNYEHYR